MNLAVHWGRLHPCIHERLVKFSAKQGRIGVAQKCVDIVILRAWCCNHDIESLPKHDVQKLKRSGARLASVQTVFVNYIQITNTRKSNGVDVTVFTVTHCLAM